MALTKVAPAGIGSTPGDGYRIGSSFLHSTGVELTNANASGIVTAAQFDGKLNIGIATFTDDVTFTGATSGRNVFFDKSENSLEFGDYTYAKFGVDEDLSIFSQNTLSVINNKTGELRIPSAGNVRILKRHDGSGAFAGELANFKVDGAVELFNAGSKKFSTSGIGVTITGQLDVGNVNSTGVITATKFVGDIAVGSSITYADNEKAYFGTDLDGTIKHTGTNFQIHETTGNIQITNYANDKDVAINSDDGSGGTANYFLADGSTGEAILYNYGNEKLKTTSSGATVTGTIIGNNLTLSDNDPELTFTDLNNNPDYRIKAESGNLSFEDTTNGNAARLRINADGHVDVTGNLDVGAGIDVTGNVKIPDDNEVMLGTNSDLRMFHANGNANFIQSYNNNDLRIHTFGTSAQVKLQVNESQNSVVCTANGKTELAYSGTTKFETTSSGATITGNLTFASAPAKAIALADNKRIYFGDGDDMWIGSNGSNGEVSGSLWLYNHLYLYDNVRLRIGHGQDLELYHNATDSYIDNNTGNLIIDSASNIIFETGSSTERLRITGAGEVLIGRTTKPNDINKLVVTGTSPADNYDSQLFLEGSETNGNANTGGALAFGGHDGSTSRNWGNIFCMKENGTGGNRASYMAFHTRPGGGAVTERLRIASDGRIFTSGRTSYSGNTTCDDLVVGDGSGHRGIAISSGSSSEGGIHFGDGESGNSSYRGILGYNHADDSMQFRTAAAERLRIDQNGNVSIGGGNNTVPRKLWLYDGSNDPYMRIQRGSTGSVIMGGYEIASSNGSNNVLSTMLTLATGNSGTTGATVFQVRDQANNYEVVRLCSQAQGSIQGNRMLVNGNTVCVFGSPHGTSGAQARNSNVTTYNTVYEHSNSSYRTVDNGMFGGTFVVGGNASYWYPVWFSLPTNSPPQELWINKYVHNYATWDGSLFFRASLSGTGYGAYTVQHRVHFYSSSSKEFIGKIIYTSHNNAWLVCWMRGGGRSYGWGTIGGNGINVNVGDDGNTHNLGPGNTSEGHITNNLSIPQGYEQAMSTSGMHQQSDGW